jgi:aminoglycoside phosphotransferase (APT) family kinase protein
VPWTADVTLDEGAVRRLLSQFPELAVDSLRPLAAGWDYAVWIVNEQWAFRFPRRQIAIPGVEREIRVLPSLAPHLPLEVPVPVFVGTPADGYPWPFFGARLLPGRELGDIALDDAARARLGVTLARFLRQLHSIDADAELPLDPNARADMARRVPKAREQLVELEALGWPRLASADRLLDEAERLPPPTQSTVAHGDLHFRQVLAHDDATPTGVIDWVDVCRGDPAIDLSMFWSFVPPSGREAFLEEYGGVTDDQLLRARIVALSLGAALARYGKAEGFANVEREALGGLARTMLE